jgi:hypothetical protein
MLRIITLIAALFFSAAQAQVASHRLPYPAFKFEQVRFPRGAFGNTVPSFNGNPNVIISGISGAVVANRDTYPGSGQIPYFIQVSASGISATGTSAPYEDLSYSWRFLINGVAQCGDTFTRPTDGASVCSGTGQRGPEAAFVQRIAGTLTVELTVTGCAGGVGLVGTANQGICTSLYGPVVFTKNYTVSAFSGTDNYADCNATPGTADGSQTHPWVTLSQMSSAIVAGNIWLHLKPGCAWTSDGTAGYLNGLDVDPTPGANPSNIRVDGVYPSASGARPKITVVSGAGTGAIRVNNGGNGSPSTVSDAVYSGIDLVMNTSTQGALQVATNAVDGAAALISNLYFDNVTATMICDCGGKPVVGIGGTNTTDHTFTTAAVGLWNFTSYSDPTYVTTDVGEQGSSRSWYFRVGGSVTGAGNSAVFQSQQIYPDIHDHALFQWVTCGQTGTTSTHRRAYCFNGNWDGIFGDPTDHQITQYWTFAENVCQYTYHCIDMGNRTNNQSGDSTVQFQYVVAMGNAIVGQSPEDFQCGLSVTFRDNRQWGLANLGTGGGFYQPSNLSQAPGYLQGTNLLSKVYRNKIYITSGSDAGAAVRFENPSPPTTAWTVKQIVTDNWIVDARSTAEMQNLTWTDLQGSSSVVNRNLYSSTASFANAWQNAGTGTTYTNWQNTGGWDAAGSNVTPSAPSGWTLPVTQWSHMN